MSSCSSWGSVVFVCAERPTMLPVRRVRDGGKRTDARPHRERWPGAGAVVQSPAEQPAQPALGAFLGGRLRRFQATAGTGRAAPDRQPGGSGKRFAVGDTIGG